MAELPPDAEMPAASAEEDAGPERESPPGTPGWVKAFGIVVIVLILVVIVAQLLFGIQHGPGLHAPSG